MVSYLTQLVALAAIIAPIFAAPAPTAGHLKIRTPDVAARDIIPGSYIVVYNANVTTTTMETHLESVSALLSKRDTAGGIGATYNIHDSFAGYAITADAATIDAIAAAPEVAYVEQDAKVYASTLTTQTGAPWGLGRISHRAKGTTTYIYDTTAGSGITVYVVDTGVYAAHSQFGGRASMGANFVSGSANTDENGHGTHCSGTIAGSTYGVAKSAKIVGVKVLDASGSGTTSGVISGIQWVATNAAAKSVLSMSLGGAYSSALNSAVTSTVSSGVTVVVAAGNNNANAANYSPASATSAITVGAIDQNDARASFSNYGSVLDVFAPGVNVLSAWIGSTTATNTISGTSMATPHVAGLAAYLIALEGLSTPAAVVARITALATSGVITSAGSGSPNLIAYNGNGA
ncbi:subtilisin-like serine protease PR1A-like protein [Coleophoma cylindrospora]|uniref:Subtilisin-like serine protease PR1A-like protein n=1 Tax=Coleophoma cylindrospora TaxID=1849047 RepID=A0A3D8S9D9_9HELO|nr:subtilisin-like serine protease PR1A-like protein [Coleophoma cylindrospora]